MLRFRRMQLLHSHWPHRFHLHCAQLAPVMRARRPHAGLTSSNAPRLPDPERRRAPEMSGSALHVHTAAHAHTACLVHVIAQRTPITQITMVTLELCNHTCQRWFLMDLGLQPGCVAASSDEEGREAAARGQGAAWPGGAARL